MQFHDFNLFCRAQICADSLITDYIHSPRGSRANCIFYLQICISENWNVDFKNDDAKLILFLFFDLLN
jgi:hypothetical protein